jgi:hypothetical protein
LSKSVKFFPFFSLEIISIGQALSIANPVNRSSQIHTAMGCNLSKEMDKYLDFFNTIHILPNEDSFLVLVRGDCYKIRNYDYSDLIVTYDWKRE